MNDAVLYTILGVLVALATVWAVIDEIRATNLDTEESDETN